MSDYSSLTVEQLEAKNANLMEQKAKIREEQRAIQAELDQRIAAEKFSSMTEAEKAALKDMLSD